MYIVQWCDHEGNLQERQFRRLGDAELEAVSLNQNHDGVRVLNPAGEVVESWK